eukprot:15327623-Ditylum_brightwellii.AAC.1
MADSSFVVATSSPEAADTPCDVAVTPSNIVKSYLSEFGGSGGGKEQNLGENNADMAGIDAGSTSQKHDDGESRYQVSDDGKSTVNDGRKCATKSVPPRQGTTLPVIEENIPVLDMGPTSEIVANANTKKSNDIVGVDGYLCSSIFQNTLKNTSLQGSGSRV